MVRIGDAISAAATSLVLNVTKFIPYHARNGVPELNVLYTSDEDQAWYFLRNRLNSTVLGLDMQWRPPSKEHPLSRSSILQIAADDWVLLYDVLPTPWYGLPPQPLSERFCQLLQQPTRTFYGMVLANDVARLAFELDCVVNKGVDLRKTPWPASNASGGIVALGNRVLGTTLKNKVQVAMSNWEWRELTPQQLRFMTEKVYLSWAIADHFLKKHGNPRKDSALSEVEIYAAGRVFRKSQMAMRSTNYDWSKVRVKYLQEKKKRRAEKLKAEEEAKRIAEAKSASDAIAAERKAKKAARRQAKAEAAEAAEAEARAAEAADAAAAVKAKAAARRQAKAKAADAEAKAAEAADAAAAAKAKKAARRQAKAEAAEAEANAAEAAEAAAAAAKEAKKARRKAKEAAAAAAAAEEEAAAKLRAAKEEKRSRREKSSQSRRAVKVARELTKDAARGRSSKAAAAAAAAEEEKRVAAKEQRIRVKRHGKKSAGAV